MRLILVSLCNCRMRIFRLCPPRSILIPYSPTSTLISQIPGFPLHEGVILFFLRPGFAQQRFVDGTRRLTLLWP